MTNNNSNRSGIKKTVNHLEEIRGGYDLSFDYEIENAGIENVSVKLAAGNLKIMQGIGEKFHVGISGHSRSSNFTVKIKGNTLEIATEDENFKFGIIQFKTNIQIAIFVPNDFFGLYRAKVGAGNLISQVDMQYLDAKIGAGNVEISNTTLGETRLSTGAGGVKITTHDICGNISAKIGAGHVEMYVPNDVDCRFEGSSSFIVSWRANVRGNPDSENIFKASLGTGSVKIMPIQ